MDDKILWDIIDRLRDDLNIAQDGITDLNDVVKDLQAEAIDLQADNKRLNAEIEKSEDARQVMYNDMDAEVRELKAECWCGGNNDVKAELNALREQELDLIRDKDELKNEIIELKEDRREKSKTINELMIDKNRLMNQVSSNRGSNSNTHTHTISREIDDYMSHNPTCKEARLFIVPIEEFDEDECCNKWITWDEGMEV